MNWTGWTVCSGIRWCLISAAVHMLEKDAKHLCKLCFPLMLCQRIIKLLMQPWYVCGKREREFVHRQFLKLDGYKTRTFFDAFLWCSLELISNYETCTTCCKTTWCDVFLLLCMYIYRKIVHSIYAHCCKNSKLPSLDLVSYWSVHVLW